MLASGSMSPTRPLAPWLVLLVALVVAGCGFVETTPPAPTPADFQGIANEFVKRGIVIDHIVSGDPGCADKVLTPTAIAFDAKGLDQTTPVRIYIYAFADRAAFERLRQSIDVCAKGYVTDPATYETVEESPYVLASQGPWGSQFEATLRAALKIAAGTGDRGPAEPQ